MKHFLICLLALFSLGAQAVTLDSLQQRFSEQPVLRAEFTQQRSVSGMDQKLNSSGNLLISREEGLWWQQQKPFALSLLLTNNRMVQTMAGQAPQVVTAQNNPQMFQFNGLLSALFHADHRALAQNFALDFSDKGQGKWVLILKPTTSPLNKLFKTITLDGQDFLNHINIDDMQGDSTQIQFFNQRTEPKTLTDAEKQHFSS